MFVLYLCWYASDMFIYLLHEFAHCKSILNAFIADVNCTEKKKHAYKFTRFKSCTAQFAVLDSRPTEKCIGWYLCVFMFWWQETQKVYFSYRLCGMWERRSFPVCQPFFLPHIITYTCICSLLTQGGAWFFSTFQNIQRSYHFRCAQTSVCMCVQCSNFTNLNRIRIDQFVWVWQKKLRICEEMSYICYQFEMTRCSHCMYVVFRENRRLKVTFAWCNGKEQNSQARLSCLIGISIAID